MPTITSDCLGNCFVAWVKEEHLSGHYNFDVYCKSFDINNNQLSEEIKVNDDDGIPVAEQSSPDIAVSQNGNFIICWLDFRNNSGIEIYAQRFLNDGSFIGNNFKVSNKKSYIFSSPKISITPNENFVIVWIQNPLTQNPNDFPKTQIVGQFYNSKGEAIDSNIILSELPLNYQNDIGVISANGLENYIISWRTADDSTNNIKIYFQLFSNSGIAQSDKILLDDDINFEDQFVPSISVFPNNNFIISWLALDKKDSTETLFAQIFSADCNRIGEKYKISSSDKRLYIAGNKVAVNSDGSFKIYWVEADAINQKRYLKFQKFTNEGNIQESVKTLEVNNSIYNSIFEPYAIDENGNFIILDLQEIDLHNYIYYAQRFDNDGNKLNSNFKLLNHENTTAGGFNIEIKNSRIYSTWTESQNDNDSDVWANILDWNNPTSIKTKETSVIPLNSELFQNYPNPFNPTTKIKYTIPQNVKGVSTNVETQNIASVQLKIYDILGREVKTLVNANQKPGNYEVEFDGSNLPSGVYFYKLQTGVFTETKKMILLK
ncbi:MAG: T9SS type A sorting domain-containing protein [Ignavibacteriae bacterium]|nr:T9SS type A sorting domain-containing protein [Ignavibacteriota bacterium]